MVTLAAHRLAFFPSSRKKSPALSQLHPKSKVTGFASFSQLLLENANADADSSTGFLCGRKGTKLAQALFQNLWQRTPSSFQNPNRSFRAIRHITTTKSKWKMDCPHLRVPPAQESPPLLLLPAWMSAGFSPALCSAYLLLATGCLRLLSSSGLHCLQAPQASPVTL